MVIGRGVSSSYLFPLLRVCIYPLLIRHTLLIIWLASLRLYKFLSQRYQKHYFNGAHPYLIYELYQVLIVLYLLNCVIWKCIKSTTAQAEWVVEADFLIGTDVVKAGVPNLDLSEIELHVNILNSRSKIISAQSRNYASAHWPRLMLIQICHHFRYVATTEAPQRAAAESHHKSGLTSLPSIRVRITQC